jgi:hypothetical protein
MLSDRRQVSWDLLGTWGRSRMRNHDSLPLDIGDLPKPKLQLSVLDLYGPLCTSIWEAPFVANGKSPNL